MAKDDTITVRVPKLKKSRAVKILKKIDLSMTTMVNKMLDEIYFTGGNPFDINQKKGRE